MRVSRLLMSALAPVGLPVEAGIYTGEEDAYLTFSYNLLPVQRADNRPVLELALIQVHLLCPLGVDYTAWADGVRAALVKGGFACPALVDATDRESRHLVFETEIVTKLEGLE